MPDASRPGSTAPDAPQGNGWLLPQLGGGFTVLGVGCTPPEVPGCTTLSIAPDDTVTARYLGEAPQAIYLIRPDQIVGARWVVTDAASIAQTLGKIREGAL